MPEDTTTATVTEEEVVAPEMAETAETPEQETLDSAALKTALEGAQAQIAKLNKENEKRRLAEKAAAEQKLADDGKLKELAEQRAKERDDANADREALTEKVKKANEHLLANVKLTIEKWPDEVKNLVPLGDDADAFEAAEKVDSLKPLAEKLMNAAAKPGSSPGPVAQGGLGSINDATQKKSIAGQVKSVF